MGKWSGSTEQVSTMTPFQQKLSGIIGGMIQEGMRKRTSDYPGQLTTPLHEGYYQSMYRLRDPMMSGIKSMMSGKPQDLSGYFNKSVRTPMLRMYETDIAPRINEAFGAPGIGATFSTRAGDAKRQALEELNTQMSADITRATVNAYENAQQRKLQALAMGPQAMYSLFSPFQQKREQNTQIAYQEWMRQRPENNPWLKLGMGFIGEPMVALQQQPGLASMLGGALGLGAGVLGVAAGIPPVFGALGGLFGGPSVSQGIVSMPGQGSYNAGPIINSVGQASGSIGNWGY